MRNENECILSISFTIHTEQDSNPEDDDMGPPSGHTLMDKLDKMEGLYMEVSGKISNTDCAPLTKEDYMLLEEICNSNSGQ
jgi:hypothetical protein